MKDESGAIIQAATVSVVSEATTAQRVVQTSDAGFYVVPFLPPGRYRVLTSAPGFQTVSRSGLVLEVGQHVRLDLRLSVGARETTVTVTAERALVNTQDATVATTIDAHIVQNMPLNGRTIQPLLALTPGVLTVSSYPTPGQFVANGQRPSANYLMLDGASANVGVEALGRGIGPDGTGALPAFAATGTTSNLVSPENLAEFQVMTSTYSPEFGRTPGAQITMVTKSGTNTFHGSASTFLRDGRFDASDWFLNRSALDDPGFGFRDVGANLGGPLVRSRAFFFLYYEGQRLDQPRTAVQQTPSQAVRQNPSQNAALLNAFPAPNGPDLSNGWATFTGAWTDKSKVDSASIRIDAQVKTATLFARYAYSSSESNFRGGSSALTTATTTQTAGGFLTAGVTSSGPLGTLVEARFNVSTGRTDTTRAFSPFGQSSEAPLVSLLGPGIDPSSTYAAFYLATGISGGWFAQGPVGGGRQRQYNAVLNLTRAVASHVIKLGIDYRTLAPEATQSPLSLTFTGAGPASLAAGGAIRLTAVASDGSRADFHNLSTYIQDTWQATSRLSLVYGLRWDYNPPPTSGGSVQPVLVRGYLDTGVPVLDTDGGALWHADARGFAPRVGAAYVLAGNADRLLVLRGGAGIFYDLGTALAGLPFGGGFPYQRRLSQTAAALPLANPAFAPLDLAQPGTSTVYVYPDRLQLPRTYEWNTALEWSLGGRNTLSATYVGASGSDLLHRESYDLTSPYALPRVEAVLNNGYSRYQSLQLQFRRRFSGSFGGTVSYTLASSKDTDSHGVTSQPPSTRYDVNLDYGPSDYDVRHALTAAMSYTSIARHPLLSAGRSIRW